MKQQASRSRLAPTPRTAGERLRRIGQAAPRRSERGKAEIENLIVIGASAGGWKALTLIFQSLPPDIPAAIVLVLHQGAGSPFRMAAVLGRLTRLPIVPVEKSEPLRRGAIFIPSPGMSLWFRPGRIQESTAKARPGARTTIDRMFASAADVYGDRVIGVVLTGILSDGTDGLRAVHDRGGLTIVQDPEGAEYGDMPRNASENLPVTFSLALRDIGPALDLLARRSARLETGIAVSAQLLRKRVELLVRLRKQSAANAGSFRFLDEELRTLRRDLKSITRLLRSVPQTKRI